jgi:hypothetical protein
MLKAIIYIGVIMIGCEVSHHIVDYSGASPELFNYIWGIIVGGILSAIMK